MSTYRFLFIFLFSTAFALTQKNGKIPYEPGQQLPDGALSPAYTAPGRVDVMGYWDFDIQASFLYWQAKEVGLDFAYVVPSDPTNQRGVRINKHFNYHPGFQLSVGTDLHHDGWNCSVEYTYLHTTEHHSSFSPSWAIGMEPTWLPTNSPDTSLVFGASARWKFKYDMLDVEFDRPSYLGKTFILSPYFGFRGGWIRQHFNPAYEILGVGQINVRAFQRASLLGPRLGLMGKAFVGKGFRFNIASYASLLYQDAKMHLLRQNFANPAQLLTNVKDKKRNFIPNVDLSLGFGWGSYFYKGNFFFDAFLNFDILYYWGQNFMRGLKDVTDARTNSDKGDLNLQGLTAGMGFYF